MNDNDRGFLFERATHLLAEAERAGLHSERAQNLIAAAQAYAALAAIAPVPPIGTIHVDVVPGADPAETASEIAHHLRDRSRG